MIQKLDEEQLETLVTAQGAGVPLWLYTACEELRVFGSFRSLTARIAGLPGQLAGLLEAVVTRLTGEDETGYMAKVSSAKLTAGISEG